MKCFFGTYSIIHHTHTQHTKMPLSATDRAMTTHAYNIENNHLNMLLKKKEEEGKVNPASFKTCKIKRAILLHALNGDKEKAQHKLSEYIQHCQELMEDLLEDRENYTFVSVDEDGTREAMDMEKDGPYKAMCDLLMEDTKCMKILIDLM